MKTINIVRRVLMASMHRFGVIASSGFALNKSRTLDLMVLAGLGLTVALPSVGCRGQRQVVTQPARSNDTVDKVSQTTEEQQDPKPLVQEPKEKQPPPPKKSEDVVLKGECTTELTYDPTVIPCALPANKNQTIWDRVEAFSKLIAGLKHPEAYWLGVGETVTDPAPDQTAYDYCPFSPYAEKAAFVSHFRLTAKTEITLEALADDAAIVRLWKNADPQQAVFESAKGISLNATITLEPGFYSVIVTVEDKAQGAFGAVFTAYQKDGTVLRQTEDSADWCVYRLSSETSLSEFLRSAAACQPCLTGENTGP